MNYHMKLEHGMRENSSEHLRDLLDRLYNASRSLDKEYYAIGITRGLLSVLYGDLDESSHYKNWVIDYLEKEIDDIEQDVTIKKLGSNILYDD